MKFISISFFRQDNYEIKIVANEEIITMYVNTNFSYEDHLNMPKTILEQSISEIKKILSKPKNRKS